MRTRSARDPFLRTYPSVARTVASRRRDGALQLALEWADDSHEQALDVDIDVDFELEGEACAATRALPDSHGKARSASRSAGPGRGGDADPQPEEVCWSEAQAQALERASVALMAGCVWCVTEFEEADDVAIPLVPRHKPLLSRSSIGIHDDFVARMPECPRRRERAMVLAVLLALPLVVLVGYVAVELVRESVAGQSQSTSGMDKREAAPPRHDREASLEPGPSSF